jgi:hypothetical protein
VEPANHDDQLVGETVTNCKFGNSLEVNAVGLLAVLLIAVLFVLGFVIKPGLLLESSLYAASALFAG